MGSKPRCVIFLQKETKQDPGFVENNLADICASLQNRIVTILLKKLKKAALQTGISQLCIAGGVSANSGLRQGLRELCQHEKWKAFIPPFEYCTDNAAMIAMTAYYKYLNKDFVDLSVTASARANWYQ